MSDGWEVKPMTVGPALTACVTIKCSKCGESITSGTMVMNLDGSGENEWLCSKCAEGPVLTIASITIPDPLIAENKALRRQVAELQADNAVLWGGLKWLKAISFSHEDDLDQWPGEKTADYINGLIERPHPGATLLKERDEILARIGIAEKALGLACGWLAEEKLQGCSANHPLVLKAKDQIKHGALSQAKESLK